MTLNPTKSICIKVNNELNCDKWSSEAGEVGELECL